MGETRVDLLHLLEDLRDAYPGALEETILTEIVANSLDSGASRIVMEANPSEGMLMVKDNGSGMQRKDLSRYHDIASSTKRRGQGIGFAGVGIKLGLLVCKEVLTETKRGQTHVSTTWHLSSRHRAPWKWVPPIGMVIEQGTAVRLTFQNVLSPLLDQGFLEGVLSRHFQPLLDPTFSTILNAHYPQGVVFEIHGMELPPQRFNAPVHAPLEIRLLRKRKPSAVGYLVRTEHPLSEDLQGLAISTYGKVIKSGWDWLGITPQAREHISGLIEVPGLAASLTLNKGDFIRVGARGATYLAYRKAIQEAVQRQLTEWGVVDSPVEETPPRQIRPLERDLERVLEDLSDLFPLLGSLVEHRKGGQKRLPLGTPGPYEYMRAVMVPGEASQGQETEEELVVQPPGNEPPSGETQREPREAGEDASVVSDFLLPDRGSRRAPARFGLGIQFEDREDDQEIGRLVESTVWVNRAHPAYQRAVATRSVGYHIALAVGLALAPLAVEASSEHAFLTAFLSCWGEASLPKKKKSRTGKR
ncbi:MAG: ATP-binding protein [Nitrospirales bacterium]